MSCGDPIYWRAGTTKTLRVRFRDKDSGDYESLTGLTPRAQFRTSAIEDSLLDLSEGSGLTMDSDATSDFVLISVTSAQTRTLAVNNKRTELNLALELFISASSPEDVPYSEIVAVVVTPEFAREP